MEEHAHIMMMTGPIRQTNIGGALSALLSSLKKAAYKYTVAKASKVLKESSNSEAKIPNHLPLSQTQI